VPGSESQVDDEQAHQCQSAMILVKLHRSSILLRKIGHLLNELQKCFLFLFREPTFLRIDQFLRREVEWLVFVSNGGLPRAVPCSNFGEWLAFGFDALKGDQKFASCGVL